MKVVVFLMGDQQYGISIENVLGIEKLHAITNVPETSDFIKGVINLRGDITPVLDLKQRFKLGETAYREQTRILIVTMNDMQVGLIVDAATDVMDIDSAIIEDAPQMINGVKESFLNGVAKLEDKLLILLDLEYVLNLDEVNEVNEMMET
ncbi:chemotaxis protein CheW [Virgibacillus sp. YIM 98842]|jgi:purine-binding chemotaxis protein CheW|uniref:chemotaxis protein CheW n=1 Tax=Virgibacillus sp. YIM 98842 TaxID=2663533 RepID=UPI0013DB4E3D|nr:chemotaxis protein CheW [Virgibacillus sp. YIM 98842]